MVYKAEVLWSCIHGWNLFGVAMSNYEVIAGQAVMEEHPRALSWCVLNVERLTGSMTGSRRKVWKLD